ncbi:hypothetical protein PIB30_040348 [Stylosanthes scabra]|uniref:BED-type domain-containing protein n=1 Tax=Stylosanthes scabra TaxID=79078 RepID=A0ABU6VD80_9FABA|nr:hypothetical protein [Stylosanthes scabra]
MGGGDAPQMEEENKDISMDHEVIITSTPAPVSEQVNEEKKAESNEGQEAVRLGKTSYVWTHFKLLPLSENKGEHKAKCNHCRKVYLCHPTKHGTNSLNKHLKASHKWIFTKAGKRGTLHGFMPKVGEEGAAGKTFKGYSARLSPGLARAFKWPEGSVASSGLGSGKGLGIRPGHYLGPGPGQYQPGFTRAESGTYEGKSRQEILGLREISGNLFWCFEEEDAEKVKLRKKVGSLKLRVKEAEMKMTAAVVVGLIECLLLLLLWLHNSATNRSMLCP